MEMLVQVTINRCQRGPVGLRDSTTPQLKDMEKSEFVEKWNKTMMEYEEVKQCYHYKASHRMLTLFLSFQRFSRMQDALNLPGIFNLGAISKALAINCLLLTDRPAHRSSLRNLLMAASSSEYLALQLCMRPVPLRRLDFLSRSFLANHPISSDRVLSKCFAAA